MVKKTKIRRKRLVVPKLYGLSKNHKPLISIVIPTFNEEEDLVACLRSIMKQTIAANIEVIIVDDDSTDATRSIAMYAGLFGGLHIKIVRNGTHDAEVGKRIGLDHAEGKYFQYCDADMEFRDAHYFEAAIKPLEDWSRDYFINGKTFIVGTIAAMGCNPKHNALTRCISQDVFQRDPIFEFFTPSIKESIITKLRYFKENGYHVCWLTIEPNNIPAQSLILYRTDILKQISKEEHQLMDNDIPIKMVKHGYHMFAFNPNIRIYHKLLQNLSELWNKRMRGVMKTYMPNPSKREFKWFNLSTIWNKMFLGLYVINANLLFFQTCNAIADTIHKRDLACMYRPLIDLVSTDALVWGFLKSKGWRSLKHL